VLPKSFRSGSCAPLFVFLSWVEFNLEASTVRQLGRFLPRVFRQSSPLRPALPPLPSTAAGFTLLPAVLSFSPPVLSSLCLSPFFFFLRKVLASTVFYLGFPANTQGVFFLTVDNPLTILFVDELSPLLSLIASHSPSISLTLFALVFFYLAQTKAVRNSTFLGCQIILQRIFFKVNAVGTLPLFLFSDSFFMDFPTPSSNHDAKVASKFVFVPPRLTPTYPSMFWPFF